MRRSLTLLFAAALTCTVAAGCSKRSSGPHMPKSEKKALVSAKFPVNVLDKKLESRIASETQSTNVREDGLREVAVTVRNRSYEQLHVQIRTVFKDADGISTGDESMWDDVYLSPQQSQTYRQVSKSAAPPLYTVEVRLPRKPGK
jgi:uncharacterized protein YcfL